MQLINVLRGRGENSTTTPSWCCRAQQRNFRPSADARTGVPMLLGGELARTQHWAGECVVSGRVSLREARASTWSHTSA